MERRVLLTEDETEGKFTILKHTIGGQCTATGVG